MSESSDLPQATSDPSPADADHDSGEDNAPEDSELAGVRDEGLPEDLQPGEDNPLAEPLDQDAEETKDAEELGMQDTSEDTTGEYTSDGPTPAGSQTGNSPDPEGSDSSSDSDD